jgi:hypothetical protein
MQLLTPEQKTSFLDYLTISDSIDICAICQMIGCAENDYKYTVVKDLDFAKEIETVIKAKFKSFQFTRLAIAYNIQVKALRQIPKELEEQEYEQIEEINSNSINKQGETTNTTAEKKITKKLRASERLLLQIGKNVLPEVFGEPTVKVKPMELPSLFDEVETNESNDIFDYSNLTAEERKILNELLGKSIKQS